MNPHVKPSAAPSTMRNLRRHIMRKKPPSEDVSNGSNVSNSLGCGKLFIAMLFLSCVFYASFQRRVGSRNESDCLLVSNGMLALESMRCVAIADVASPNVSPCSVRCSLIRSKRRVTSSHCVTCLVRPGRRKTVAANSNPAAFNHLADRNNSAYPKLRVATKAPTTSTTLNNAGTSLRK